MKGAGNSLPSVKMYHAAHMARGWMDGWMDG